jgi:nitroimidazol reductase NimA-like FMN-containing flavoprotein (pyridoxamine 5'-phosphate oxidase superfamily)
MSGLFADHGDAERPTTPDKSYGVPQRGGTLVEWLWVIEQLTKATDYWLATTRRDGRPHAAPIWGVFVDDNLYLESSPATLKARNLARDPRAVVSIGGGSAVVIVEATVAPVVPERQTAELIAAAMAAKYDGYNPGPGDWDGGGLFLVTPSVVLGWREMNTATRWRFAR